MVEGARLESVYTRKTRIEGSNPSLSARKFRSFVAGFVLHSGKLTQIFYIHGIDMKIETKTISEGSYFRYKKTCIREEGENLFIFWIKALPHKIQFWWEGDAMMSDNSNSDIIFIDPHYKRHWSAELLRKCVEFFKKEYRWLVPVLSSIVVTLWVAL